MNLYQYHVKDADGNEQALASYQGKVLLVVNTASKCGFTPQYAGLQELYQGLHERGLEILAFPCDQFGHQEPGSNAEIQQFCQLNYGVTFPVFARIEVNGEAADPLYHYLTSEKPGPEGSNIRWNFTKFLIDRNGAIIERFEPAVTPAAIQPAIEKLLENA